MADKSPNPYEATEATAVDAIPIDAQSINYPGGVQTVALVGLAFGVITGLFFSWSDASQSLAVVPILLWCGSFIALALVLPGSIPRRLVRAIYAFLLSIAGAILYVPVCGISLVMQDGFQLHGPQSSGPQQTIAWIVSSVLAFTSVLFLGALIIRRSARLAHRVFPNRSVPVPEPDLASPTDFWKPEKRRSRIEHERARRWR